MRVLRILLALVHVVVGAVCSLIAFPYVAIFLGADSFSSPTQVRFGQEFLPLFVVYFLPSLIGGIGLLLNARWARWLLLAQALAYLFLVPLGSALGIATLVILMLDRQTRLTLPRLRPGQGGVIITLGMVGSGMLVGLVLLFRLNGDTPPRELEALFYPGLVVLALCLVFFLLVVVPGWSSRRDEAAPADRAPGESRATHAPVQAERERIARLAADPATAYYARLIQAGEFWNDGQLAYDRDPTRLAACHHLRPIETDLRRLGYMLKLGTNNYLDVICSLDPAGLQAQYRLYPPVEYLVYPPERDGADSTPAVRCTEHGFAILGSSDPAAPRFP